MSLFMEGIKNVFSDPGCGTPKLKVLSTVTAKTIDQFNAEYCWNNMRNPVLFAGAVQNYNGMSNCCIVEISPHPVLNSSLLQCGCDSEMVVTSFRRSKRGTSVKEAQNAEFKAFLEGVGQMLCLGYEISPRYLSGKSSVPHKPYKLDLYPYKRRLMVKESKIGQWRRLGAAKQNPLTDRRLRLSLDSHPWLEDHALGGAPLMPGAGYICMALGLPGTIHVLHETSFDHALVVKPDEVVTVEVGTDTRNQKWWVRTSSELQSERVVNPQSAAFDTDHASGKLSMVLPDLENERTTVNVQELIRHCNTRINGTKLYHYFSKFIKFGESFQTLNDGFMNSEETTAYFRVNIPEHLKQDILDENDGAVIHPIVVDMMVQASMLPFLQDQDAPTPPDLRLMPRSVDRVIRYDITEEGIQNNPAGQNGDTQRIDTTQPLLILSELPADSFKGTARLVNEITGKVILSVEGVRFGRVASDAEVSQIETWTHVWNPISMPVELKPEEFPSMSTPFELPSLSLEYADALTFQCITDPINNLVVAEEPGTHGCDKQCFQTSCSTAAKEYSGRRLSEFTREEIVVAEQNVLSLINAVRNLDDMLPQCLEKEEDIPKYPIFKKQEIIHTIYNDHPYLTPLISRTKQAIQDASNHGKRVIRMLEIGAGSGTLTHLLDSVMLEARTQSNIHVELFVTDDSDTATLSNIASKMRYKAVHVSGLNARNPQWDAPAGVGRMEKTRSTL